MDTSYPFCSQYDPYEPGSRYIPYPRAPYYLHPSFVPSPIPPPFCSIVQPAFSRSSTQLLDVVSVNDLTEARSLLDARCDVNQRNDHGWAPLMEAAQKGHTQMIDLLLSRRAKLNLQTPFGDTALSLATHEKHAASVARLLEAKANTELTEHQGYTALMIATEARDQEIMTLLLRAGANVHAMNRETGWMPILYTTTPDSPSHKLLNSFGADRSASEWMSKWFLQHRPDPSYEAGTDQDSSTIPHVWVYNWVYNYIRAHKEMHMEWTFDTIREFLDFCLTSSNETKVMKMLVDGAITIQTGPRNRTMLMEAAYKNKVNILNFLLNLKVNVNEKGGLESSTALIEAAIMGHAEAVECLLDAKANTEAQDRDGWTALMYATLNQRTEVVSKLLLAGCFKEPKNAEGHTALNIASSQGFTSIVSLLLAYCADPNAVCEITGDTPLLLAALGGHKEIIKLLLLAEASPKVINHKGLTPFACFEEDSPMWKLLLARWYEVFF